MCAYVYVVDLFYTDMWLMNFHVCNVWSDLFHSSVQLDVDQSALLQHCFVCIASFQYTTKFNRDHNKSCSPCSDSFLS